MPALRRITEVNSPRSVVMAEASTEGASVLVDESRYPVTRVLGRYLTATWPQHVD